MNEMASLEKPEEDNEISSEKSHIKMKSPRNKGRKIDPILTKQENGTERPMIEKTVSCGELSSKYVKLDPCTESGNNTIIFIERGWPVKILRLTEDSPPKVKKPWHSRSLPSASIKSAPKEKTTFTQTKSILKSFKENKENKINRPTCVRETKKHSKENNASNSKPIQEPLESHDEKPMNIDNFKSDLKQALDYFDEACLDMDKISSRKNTVIEKDISVEETGAQITAREQVEKKNPKNEHMEKLNWKQHEKKVSTNEQKESSLCSARSNNYNSKEMKAYIKAKRTERKLQISEEARKKQEMIEIQKRNLEKMRERASKVLRKTPAKTVEEGFADHLKKAQEAALLKPESFFQSDPFNIINMMKLKNFNNQKPDYLVADRRPNQHLTSIRSSNEDETDAPSIVFMEEEALPLKVPDHLKLTFKSASELFPSASHKFQAWQSLSKSIESTSVPFLSSFDKRLPVSPSQLTLLDKTSYRRHSIQKEVKEQEAKGHRETHIKSNDGQFKISQVLESLCSNVSSSHSRSLSHTDRLVSDHLPALQTSRPSPLSLIKMIDDAEFQREQHQLLYKTQEDILHANYKAALTELKLRFRNTHLCAAPLPLQ